MSTSESDVRIRNTRNPPTTLPIPMYHPLDLKNSPKPLLDPTCIDMIARHDESAIA